MKYYVFEGVDEVLIGFDRDKLLDYYFFNNSGRDLDEYDETLIEEDCIRVRNSSMVVD